MQLATHHFEALQPKGAAPNQQLETFPAPIDSGIEQITFSSEEFTAFCPVTGQPDFYKIEISYEPKERCLESKSLKLYLWSFREEQAFGEYLAARIVDDLYITLEPSSVCVVLTQNVRGGIQMKVEACRYG
jgi:7-cyano-7-deazaguanine reductase